MVSPWLNTSFRRQLENLQIMSGWWFLKVKVRLFQMTHSVAKKFWKIIKRNEPWMFLIHENLVYVFVVCLFNVIPALYYSISLSTCWLYYFCSCLILLCFMFLPALLDNAFLSLFHVPVFFLGLYYAV